MNVVTIPRRIVRGDDDLVVIPRKEYEVLLARPAVREFTPTKAQKLALARAERNFNKRKLLSYDEFSRRMDALR